MNEPGAVTSDDRALTRPVFVSYASADRKQALAVCKALERRGANCWISCRDVQAGENYQESIVRALRTSRAMVLVFSEAANNSDEIKKELSLASRYHVPLLAVRIEDVEPSDAFAYELSTRQWIDAFESWEKSIDTLARRIGEVSGVDAEPVAVAAARRGRGLSWSLRGRTFLVAAVAALVVVVAGGAWWLLMRPSRAAAHPMVVRLAGFQRLSPDLPPTLPDAVDDELDAAFNDEGVIGVSTAKAPPPGSTQAYAVGGTIRHDGDKIKIITRLTNERSGVTLWSNTYTFDAANLSHVSRWAAVDISEVVRCGLFGASTYPKELPDPVLSNYLQFCTPVHWSRALDFAHKVVAAAPDFSWGWSAVTVAATGSALYSNPPGPKREAYRKEALMAADRAIRLDASNSEAISAKSMLVAPNDLLGREALLKKALAARPLACGCEHHLYADFLMDVGRTNDAIAEYKRSTDVLPLNGSTQMALGEALIIAGNPEQAKARFDAAIDLVDQPSLPDRITALVAPLTGNYAGSDKAIQNPKLGVSTVDLRALLDAFRAMQSGNPQGKAAAAVEINALPPEMISLPEIPLLGALGDGAGALRQIEAAAARQVAGPRSWLFYPSLAGARNDPSFPAVAQRLGLMKYWKTTHTKPDVCSAKDPPPFCRMI